MESPERKDNGTRRRRVWIATVLSGMILLVFGVLLYDDWITFFRGSSTPAPLALVDDALANGSLPHVSVEAIVVRPTDIILEIKAVGHLAPWKQAQVSSEATGVVVARLIEEGDRVDSHTLLVQLDDREQHLSLKEIEAEVLQKRAEYAVNEKLDETYVPRNDSLAFRQAQEAFEASQKAYAQGLITSDELEVAQKRFDLAELTSGGVRDAVQAAISGLQQAENQYARAQLALSRTRIEAPFAGSVADVEIEEGQRVGPGDPLLVLLDDSRMQVEVDVLESDLIYLRPDSRAIVRIPAMQDEVFHGTVSSINPRISPETGMGRVKLAFPNRDRRLIDGLFAEVVLERARLPDRMAVPVDAVVVRQNRTLVFRIVEGRAQWTYVSTGIRSSGWIEITEGIQYGDTVAVDGHLALAHNAPVLLHILAPDTLSLLWDD